MQKIIEAFSQVVSLIFVAHADRQRRCARAHRAEGKAVMRRAAIESSRRARDARSENREHRRAASRHLRRAEILLQHGGAFASAIKLGLQGYFEVGFSPASVASDVGSDGSEVGYAPPGFDGEIR